ncbi:MAG TPA: ABC transporter ATP-binding protein [Acidimicrobiales bacterium]|nr:ABC transporter ATP-binding protein [Acidimicrobiales bacterium]
MGRLRAIETRPSGATGGGLLGRPGLPAPTGADRGAPITAGDVAIRLDHVEKRFPGSGRAAVEDLSLDIPAGQLVALVGPSGCGKTTTLRMINRLIEPSGGRIEVDGVDVRSLAEHELRRGIGYVIQQAGLFPHRTIADNIATVPKLLRWDRARIRARVDELVELVGLDEELLGRYPAALSGGQQQRVGVARALAADPPVLLMDEPYSAVDPIVRAHLQDELLALQRRLHKTVVLVTHDIDEAIKLADQVAILDVGGVLEQYGPPAELLRAPASPFVESFLGRERALRRMALLTVADAHPQRGAVVDATAPVDEVRQVMQAHRTDWVGVLDGQRMRGWIDEASLAGARTAGAAGPRPFAAWVQPETALREALDTIVQSATRVAVVLRDGDLYEGMVTIDDIARAMER